MGILLDSRDKAVHVEDNFKQMNRFSNLHSIYFV